MSEPQIDGFSASRFWAGLALRRGDGLSVVADGAHYRIGPEDAQGFRGFGGAAWIVRFYDGRVVRTTNLWHQGEIPPAWRGLLPDNATLTSDWPPATPLGPTDSDDDLLF